MNPRNHVESSPSPRPDRNDADSPSGASQLALVSEIDSEETYSQIHTLLNQRNKPARVLRVLMNAFERYRQARKIGWSRPWNKYGLTTFASLVVQPERDEALLARARSCVVKRWKNTEEIDCAWIEQLLSDRRLMGFFFLSELREPEAEFESLTLSLGRKVADARRHRDRVDLIFDARVDNGRADHWSRIRLFVDPWRGPDKRDKAPILQRTWTIDGPDGLPEDWVALGRELVTQTGDWLAEPERSWDHWTSHYIDYFGPPRFDLSSGLLTDQLRAARRRHESAEALPSAA